MKRLEAVIAALFGVVFVFLSFAVALETFLRKAFNVSLQGIDELGGYCLAVGASLAFVLALLARAHIRIDLIHDKLSRTPRALLNAASIVTIFATALGIAVMAWISMQDSIALNSIAQTPWATPIKYPQAAWLAALALFAVVAAGYAWRALWLLFTGRLDQLDQEFQPKGTKDELKEELDDIRARGAADAASMEARP